MRVPAGSAVVAFGAVVVAAMLATLVVGVVVRPEVSMYAPTPPAPKDVRAAVVGPDTYTVDARDERRWVAFDFSRRSVVPVDDLRGLDWDLAFNRFRIRTNGGATNPAGGAGALDLGRVAFDSVVVVPDSGYAQDVSVSANETRNPALERWYDYSWLSHRLTPKPRAYAVRTADGRYAKVTVLSYYCADGTAGCVTFRYAYAGDGGRRFR
ncbi:MAG: HmuY family protein [Gemmatimonadota bacterium]